MTRVTSQAQDIWVAVYAVSASLDWSGVSSPVPAVRKRPFRMRQTTRISQPNKKCNNHQTSGMLQFKASTRKISWNKSRIQPRRKKNPRHGTNFSIQAVVVPSEHQRERSMNSSWVHSMSGGTSFHQPTLATLVSSTRHSFSSVGLTTTWATQPFG